MSDQDNSEKSAKVGPPLWLLAELTYDCPLHCPYCSNPVDLGDNKDELSTEQWCSVLTQGREMGAVQLGFSGGEPLLRKDLEQLVAHARELGFYSNLITSGIGLTDNRIDRLKAAGLDHIQVSFQAADPSLNDAIAKRGNAFEHKVKMAKKVKAEGFGMVLNFVISRQNIEQIDDILRLSCDLEADYVELATAQYYGWAWQNRDHLLPTQAQLELAEAQVNAFRQQQPEGKGPKIIFVTPDYYETRPKPCMNGWASTFINITPDGSALPCHSAKMLPIDFPNVKNTPLEDIWFKSFAMNRFRGTNWMKEPCRSCDEKHLDFGGCRCQAYLLTGDMSNTDPVCDKSPHHSVIETAISAAKTPSSPLVYRDKRADIIRTKL